jgi:pimeloyl-ACP methyl ester carboxylesterase
MRIVKMIKHNLDLYKDQAPIRRLAFREFGDVTSENILLCIPGILESQNAFDEIVNFVEQHEGCRLITVDHCGRGKSDWLDEGSTYKMSVYLEDLRTLITHLHATHKRLSRRLYLLGSSMGGLLALNLAAQKELRVKGLILNDVGLTVSWNGLFNLYNNKKNSQSTDSADVPLTKMHYDPRLLDAIRHPGHVDISYSLNFLGLHFDNGLQNFKGPVLLLRGKNSDICSSIDEQVLMRYANHAEVMSLDGEGHPVSYGPEVLSKLSEILNLHKTSISLPNDLFSTEYQNYETYSMLACA